MRKSISLNDNAWRLGSVPQQPFGPASDLERVEEWIPATVPGDVRLDLLRAGKIPDPFYGQDNEASQWIDGHDWWYLREIELDPSADVRRFLVFEGIDYQSAVFWNGRELGRHVGMFSRQLYQVPPLLAEPRSKLAVRIWGSAMLPRLTLTQAERIAQGASRHIFLSNPALPDRIATVKCQMSFGWDFAPRLRTCGIWDDARLIETRGVMIREVWAQGLPDGRVSLQLYLDTLEPLTCTVQIRVQPANFAGPSQEFHFDLSTPMGRGEDFVHFQFLLQNPQPWNPWDRGRPDLYKVTVELTDSSGTLDSETTTLGLRTIDLEKNPGAPLNEAPWTFVVNGVSEFIRGANWVPADAIPGRVTRGDYAVLLNLAREANINLLRVWGGGLREKRSFYDLCDELGLLVWQEFPFSGAPLDFTRRDDEFLALTRAECTSIVRALRGHPSVALWCGGNEFNTLANASLVRTLREVVARADGTRAFKPGSPSSGEHHNWRVWHWQANTRDYRKDGAGFMGEFGLQSLPGIPSLTRFLRPGQVWPPGADWMYHHAEPVKLKRYAQSLGHTDSLAAFVEASQQAQMRGLQIMIEHARRNKGRTGGCAFWQFNEPWPAICWSVVDYYREQKPAYAKLRQLYNPILLSFYYELKRRRPGERVQGVLWVVNDTLEAVRGELVVSLNDKPVHTAPVQVGPDASLQVGPVEIELAAGPNSLKLELGDISSNEYDLNYFDRGEIWPLVSPLQQLAARLQS